MSFASLWHFLEYSFLRYRSTWVSTLVSSTVSPMFFLFAIGFGLGSQVQDTSSLGTDDYVNFIGPGVIAATAMIQATGLSLWPTLGAIKWEGTYNAVLATPVTPRELATGHILWIGFRTLVSASLYLVVLALFGLVDGPIAVLAPLTGALTGLAFAAPISAYSVTRDSDVTFSPIIRVGVTPLFIFSGAFFPISQLPDLMQYVARVIPVWHGVEVTRGLVNGSMSLLDGLGHAGYVFAWFFFGWLLACRTFTARLSA